MGNSHSSSALETCLTSAVGGNGDLVAFPSKPLYQLVDVKPYNQDVEVHPVAVTYPETTDQVSAIVNCATAEAGYTVQARGGGHSYANYGMIFLVVLCELGGCVFHCGVYALSFEHDCMSFANMVLGRPWWRSELYYCCRLEALPGLLNGCQFSSDDWRR